MRAMGVLGVLALLGVLVLALMAPVAWAVDCGFGASLRYAEFPGENGAPDVVVQVTYFWDTGACPGTSRIHVSLVRNGVIVANATQDAYGPWTHLELVDKEPPWGRADYTIRVVWSHPLAGTIQFDHEFTVQVNNKKDPGEGVFHRIYPPLPDPDPPPITVPEPTPSPTPAPAPAPETGPGIDAKDAGVGAALALGLLMLLARLRG